MNTKDKNKYLKKVMKLYTDRLIGRRLLSYFNDYLSTITKDYINEPTNQLLNRLKDYCISENLTPNERFAIAMLIRYSNEINDLINQDNNG